MIMFGRRIACPDWLTMTWYRLVWLINYSQTSVVRFWFGLSSVGFGLFMALADVEKFAESEYRMMLALAPDHVWAALFFVHGFAVLYGVFAHKYNRLLVILEGVLGVALWCGSAAAVVITQKSFGAHVVGGMIAFWLLIRYPTHWEYKDAD